MLIDENFVDIVICKFMILDFFLSMWLRGFDFLYIIKFDDLNEYYFFIDVESD